VLPLPELPDETGGNPSQDPLLKGILDAEDGRGGLERTLTVADGFFELEPFRMPVKSFPELIIRCRWRSISVAALGFANLRGTYPVRSRPRADGPFADFRRY